MQELKELGLSDGEIKVYQAVLEIGSTGLTKIQEKTGIERRNIYDILNKLIEKGLASYIIEQNKKRFQITHPNKILEEIKKKKSSLNKIEQELPKLIKVFNQPKIEVGAQVFRGDDAIKSLFEEILDYKVCYWLGGNNFEGYSASQNLQNYFNHWMEHRAKKKILMYDLVDFGLSLKGLEPHKKKKHKSKYYKYAQLPENLKSPMVICIFGNKVAQILWGKQPFAFILESNRIKKSYMKYFEYFWPNK